MVFGMIVAQSLCAKYIAQGVCVVRKVVVVVLGL